MQKLLKSFFCIILFYSVQTGAQTITVTPSALVFGNVYENASDSLPVTISNPFSSTVNVTGIRFYNTYGQPAFSCSRINFSIAGGASEIIYIRFSPRHNIFHNSEMILENDSRRGDVSIDLQGQGKFTDSYYNQTENQEEENLKSILKAITGNGYNSLGYNNARDEMFEDIDNKKLNGQGASQNTIECIYTGREAVGYIDRPDCQTNYSFNTEHTLPQSLFQSAEPMKSDLHHLFPTDDAANGERGDNPFGVVLNPTYSNGGSLSDGNTFEPRDEAKGVIARALFYFVIRYQNYSNFLNQQEQILRTWCEQFQPGTVERIRNAAIYAVQQNKNPFVDYPVFLERIHSISTTSSAPLVKVIDLSDDTLNFGTPGAATIDYNFVIVNKGNAAVNLTGFDISNSPELTFDSPVSDATLSPGEALKFNVRYNSATGDSARGILSFHSDATGTNMVNIPVFVNDPFVTSIDRIADNDVRIFPVPSNDVLNVSLEKFSSCNISVFDVAGRNTISFSEQGNKFAVDVRNLMPGIYFLRVEMNNEILQKRFVIQRN